MVEWLKKYKNAVIISAVVLVSLASAFFLAEPPSVTNGSPVQEKSLSISDGQSRKDLSEPSEPPESPVKTDSDGSANISGKPSESEKSSVSVKASDVQNSFESSAPNSGGGNVSQVQSGENSEVIEIQVTSSEIIDSTPQKVNESPSSVPLPSDDNNTSADDNNASATESTGSVFSSADSSASAPNRENDFVCTVSISCVNALNNDMLSKSKKSVQPSDGIIMQDANMDFSDGESVFDVTKRICAEMKIPFEFSITPAYNSAYIEGINNLYQFDCGSASGWVYSVNGNFKSVSCSEIKLKNGDKIEWHYTCDLGRDVGNENASEGSQ